MYFKIIYNLFLISLFYHYTNSHSWLSCTNYQITDNSSNYDINKCSGFPRDYNQQYNSDITRGFGYDTGYEYRSLSCKSTKNDNYNLKIATYSPGQRVCLAYPAKNHVAEYCNNNPFIPDNGLRIIRSSKPNVDLFDREYKHENGNHIFGTVDYKGFQNCPKFCDNNDKALCYVCFILETDINDGIYSFKWSWEFNPNEYYTNCWDALITNNPTTNNPTTNNPTINNPITNNPTTNNPTTNNPTTNNPTTNNPFDSMELLCKSDDNLCKDNINKQRDQYNKLLDFNQNNKKNLRSENNDNQNNQNNNNQNNDNQNNDNQNNDNQNNQYEYIEKNICN